MKPEEAIKMLKYNSNVIHKTINGETDINEVEALDMAISALEKQIPKKPMIKIDVFNENLWNLYCPTCGTWVGMHNKRLKQTDMHNNTNSEICAKCGQMLDLELEDNR